MQYDKGNRLIMGKDSTISIAKGIAIICMVLGHSCTKSGFEAFVNLFHMPLFFFTAGYCFKTTYYEKPMQFLTRRTKGILLPYFFWSFVFIAFHNYFLSHGLIEGFAYSSKDVAYRIFRVLTFTLCTEDLMGAYWFLPVLFLAECFSFVLLKLFEHKLKVRKVLIIGAFVVLAEVGKIIIGMLPGVWILGNSLFSAMFFCFGYYFKRYSALLWKPSLGLAAVYTSLLLLSFIFCRTALTPCSPLQAPIFSSSAISGIFLTMMISSMILRFKFLSNVLIYIGNHTLAILTWHFLSFKVVTWILIQVGLGGFMSAFPTIKHLSPRWWWMYAIAGISLPLLVSRIYSAVVYLRKRVI